MIGRLSWVGWKSQNGVITPEDVGQDQDVDLLQGLVEGVRLVLHTDSGQSRPSLVCLRMSSSPVWEIKR